MLHIKFRESACRFGSRRFLKGFYHIWAWKPFGHVTCIMSSDFHFHIPESFHTKFGSDRHSGFEKIQFEFLYVHDLGPRSRNDLDLQYSHIFIKSIC